MAALNRKGAINNKLSKLTVICCVGESILNTIARRYATTKDSSRQAYSPVVYNLSGKTDEELECELGHLKHSYSYKDNTGELISDSRLYDRGYESWCYYYLYSPTSEYFILRRVPVYTKSFQWCFDKENGLELLTCYRLCKNQIEYVQTFFNESANNKSAMLLDCTDIIYIYSEYLRAKYRHFSIGLQVDDIIIIGTNLPIMRNRMVIRFRKLDLNQNNVFGSAIFFFSPIVYVNAKARWLRLYMKWLGIVPFIPFCMIGLYITIRLCVSLYVLADSVLHAVDSYVYTQPIVRGVFCLGEGKVLTKLPLRVLSGIGRQTMDDLCIPYRQGTTPILSNNSINFKHLLSHSRSLNQLGVCTNDISHLSLDEVTKNYNQKSLSVAFFDILDSAPSNVEQIFIFQPSVAEESNMYSAYFTYYVVCDDGKSYLYSEETKV